MVDWPRGRPITMTAGHGQAEAFRSSLASSRHPPPSQATEPTHHASRRRNPLHPAWDNDGDFSPFTATQNFSGAKSFNWVEPGLRAGFSLRAPNQPVRPVRRSLGEVGRPGSTIQQRPHERNRGQLNRATSAPPWLVLRRRMRRLRLHRLGRDGRRGFHHDRDRRDRKSWDFHESISALHFFVVRVSHPTAMAGHIAHATGQKEQ